MSGRITIPPPPLQSVTLGPFELHVYGLLVGLAVIVALTVARQNLRSRPRLAGAVYTLAIPTVLAGLVGGRLYHVATSWKSYQNDPARIVGGQGLGIYGALLFGGIAFLIACRVMRLPFGRMVDALVPGIALGQAIGRWGNYFNQELFGGPSDLPLALRVDPGKRPEGFENVATFHPTFLYESLWNLCLGLALLLLHRRWTWRPTGILLPLYVAGYSAGRFVVEGIRIDPTHEVYGLRLNQVTSASLVVVSLCVAAWMLFRARSHDGRAHSLRSER